MRRTLRSARADAGRLRAGSFPAGRRRVMRSTVGIVGPRGHTGAELIRLIARHPFLELAFVSSRELAGQKGSDHFPEFAGALPCENLQHEAVGARGADATILALPNGKAAPLVAEIDRQNPQSIIVDLSA